VTIETATVTIDAQSCAGQVDAVPGDYVLLAVSDNGCGMDADILTQVFEPFFTTKAMGMGTGLGLATVYGIVRQNHGFISVDSEPGKGTAFKIHLPRHRAREEAVVASEGLERAATGHETVLLVEDDPLILEIAITMLQTLGYTVLAAATPREALQIAKEHRGEIQVVLTDVVMPEMNGRELAKQLLGLRPGLKCVFMSGYTANVIAQHGVLDDGMHFIPKPFTLKVLADRIREALGDIGNGTPAGLA
jgi:CheY-like chemotaxis protein